MMEIEFQDVTKAFDGKSVIEGFTGSFSHGLHLLVGPSGCGRKDPWLGVRMGRARPRSGVSP